jgi:hypothetical protein
MPKMPKRPAAADQVRAMMVTIRRTDDIFVMRANKSGRQNTVFFMRGKGGAITVVWADPNVHVGSFGSAKQRRAFYARQLKALDQRDARQRKAAERNRKRVLAR